MQEVNMTAMPDSWAVVKDNAGLLEDVIFIEGQKMPSWQYAARYVLHQIWDGHTATYDKAYFDALKYLQMIKR